MADTTLYNIDILDGLDNPNLPIIQSLNFQLSDSSPVVFRVGSVSFCYNEHKSCRIILLDQNSQYTKDCKVEIIHNGVDSDGNAYTYTNVGYVYNGILDIEHYIGHDNTIKITSEYYEDSEYVMSSEESLNTQLVLTLTLVPKVSLLKDDKYIRKNKSSWESKSGFRNRKTEILTEFGSITNTVYWLSGCLAPNGKIYCVPWNGTQVLEINPETKESTLVGDVLPSSYSKWDQFAIGVNGKLYSMAYGIKFILEFDPDTYETDLISTATFTYHHGTIAAPNGKIYGCPFGNYILEFNPLTRYINYISMPTSGGAQYNGGCLAPNGKIYYAPWDKAEIAVFDPNTHEIELVGSFGGSYWGAVLAPNNKVYMLPYVGSYVLVIDTITHNTELLSRSDISGNFAHGSICNGIIYSLPYASNTYDILKINTFNNEVSKITHKNILNFTGIINYKDKLFGIPASTSILEIDTNNRENEVILDLQSDRGVYIDENMIVKQWCDISNQIVFGPSINTGNTIIKNGTIINSNNAVGTCLIFNDEDSLLYSDNLLISILLDTSFIVNNPNYYPGAVYENILSRGYTIADNNNTHFSYNIRLDSINQNTLVFGFYIGTLTAWNYKIVTINRSELTNKTNIALCYNSSKAIIIINNKTIETFPIVGEISNQVSYRNVLIGGGTNINDACFKSLISVGIEHIQITKNHNIDVSQYGIGDKINISNLNLLPISRYTDLYFSTFNKNTIKQDDVNYQSVIEWKSDSSDISLTRYLTDNYPTITRDGVKYNTSRQFLNYSLFGSNSTIEFWVKIDEPYTSNRTIISLSNFSIIVKENSIEATIDSVILTYNKTIFDNKWYHIAISYIDTINLYINGILVDYSSDLINEQIGDLIIGNFVGYLDNFRLSNTVCYYNIAGVELNDFAFIPSRRNSNMLPENIQWIPYDEVDDIVVALSSKNNLTFDYLGRVSSWKSNFNDLIVSQTDTNLMPTVVKNEGLYFDGVGKYNLNLSTIDYEFGDNTVMLECYLKLYEIAIGYVGLVRNATWANYPQSQINLYLHNNTMYFAVTDGTNYNTVSCDYSIILGNYVHLSCVRIKISDTLQKMYIIVDGIIVNVVTNSLIHIPNVNAPFHIGLDNQYNALEFNIDQIKISTSNIYNITGNEQIGDKIYQIMRTKNQRRSLHDTSNDEM